MNGLPKLPIGIQSFDKLRNGNYLYVDKTKYLIDLIDNGSVYFLSRPRRFGKSLTVSTFDALFSGKKELFKELYAEDFFKRAEYRTYPVIHLDMSDLTTHMGPDELRASMMDRLKESAKRLDVAIESTLPGDAFSSLISRTAEKYNLDVVLLIDEYDKPILDSLFDAAKVNATREILRDFYTRIKAVDKYLRFIFMTGISKFSKMGVFSALNNLEDISMDESYATMLGYTEEELLSNFDGYIDDMAAALGEKREEMLTRIRDYYDGFSFDGKNMLYNPFSTLNFFRKRKFLNYWFETGTPSYLARYMKDRKLTVEEFRNMDVSLNFASTPGEMENATAANFLYQSGYLSLRPGVADDYSLDYPNFEVLSSMSRLLTENILGDQGEAEDSRRSFRKYLMDKDVPGVVAEFNRLFEAIPYDDYTGAAQKTIKAHRLAMNAGEWLYRSTLFSFLCGMGLDVEAETHSSRGRSDLRVKFMDYTWIFELKVRRGEEETKKAADEALEQIIKKGYANRYPRAVLLGVAIDDTRRSITAYRECSTGRDGEI
jgi:hypothetical protein